MRRFRTVPVPTAYMVLAGIAVVSVWMTCTAATGCRPVWVGTLIVFVLSCLASLLPSRAGGIALLVACALSAYGGIVLVLQEARGFSIPYLIGPALLFVSRGRTRRYYGWVRA